MVLSGLALADLADITLSAGAPTYIVLDVTDGYEAGDALTYTVSCNNDQISTLIPDDANNQSLKISVKDYGEMVFQLFEELAPNTTDRIIELAGDDFYENVIFHRVIDDFMIQAGDPTGTGSGGSDLGDFDDEFNELLMHTVPGMLSMAKSNDDTGDSQFFVTEVATRWLDFNHSVFGFQTDGEDVRDAISEVAVDGDDKPTTDVVIESVDVFTDTRRGVLILSAPEGYTGTATVTVTVDDGNGGTTQRQFDVDVVADTDTYADSAPWLDEMDPIEVVSGEAGDYQIPAFDIEGDDIYYAGQVSPENDDIELFVDASTGEVSYETSAKVAGIHGLFFGVRAFGGTSWDTQAVPLFVTPAAPSVDFLASTDTGVSDTDDITNLNNASANEKLWFRVSGLVSGAEVHLYAGDQLIGQGTATSDTLTIVTDGDFELSDGVHSIRATQTFSDEADIGNQHYAETFTSDLSDPVAITVDTSDPEITSAPSTETLPAGELYQYDVQSNEESAGNVRYRLDNSPAGMTIDAETGVISWTPSGAAAGPFSISVVVSDLAGNEDSQDFELSVNLAPVFESVSAKSVSEGSLLEFTLVAADEDGGLEYRLTEGAPEGATINATTGLFSWTPSEEQGPDEYFITVQAVDAFGSVGQATFKVNVWESNSPPQIESIADQVAVEDEAFVLDVVATDPDIPSTLTYSLADGAPDGAAIDPETGRITWTPNESQGGKDHAITVIVTDNTDVSVQTSFTVSVAEDDKPPAFVPMEPATVFVGETLQLEFRAADQDLPANGIRYSLEPGAPADAVIDPETGAVTWSVPSGQPSGTVSIGVRATEVRADGTLGLSTTAVAEVRVLDYADLVAAAAATFPTMADGDSEIGDPSESAVDSVLSEDSIDLTGSPIGGGDADLTRAGEGLLGFQFGAEYGLGMDGGAGSPDAKPADEEAAPFETRFKPTSPVARPKPQQATPAASKPSTPPPATPARPAKPQPRGADVIMEYYEREY